MLNVAGLSSALALACHAVHWFAAYVNSLKHTHHEHVLLGIPPSYQYAWNVVSWRIRRPKYAHQAIFTSGHPRRMRRAGSLE